MSTSSFKFDFIVSANNLKRNSNHNYFMKNTKNKTKIGMILIILGLIILVINAVDYLSGFFGLSLGIALPSSGLGIVLFITGYLFGWLYPAAKEKKKE